jgi:hypothetical protein
MTVPVVLTSETSLQAVSQLFHLAQYMLLHSLGNFVVGSGKVV